jgi:hypothetical protein
MYSLQFILLTCLALYAASEMVISRPLESMISSPEIGIIAVDLQKSFVENELPVPGADNIFGPISILMEFFPKIPCTQKRRRDIQRHRVEKKWQTVVI